MLHILLVRYTLQTALLTALIRWRQSDSSLQYSSHLARLLGIQGLLQARIVKLNIIFHHMVTHLGLTNRLHTRYAIASSNV